MPKTSKTILKRIRVTKTGKLIRRHPGQNHFNAKESRRAQRRKGPPVSFMPSFARQILSRV